MVYKEQTLRSADGLALNVYEWLCESPRAVVVISHGWSEHAGRYAALARWLNLEDISVYALDHRGHGKSEGLRGHVDSWQQYVDDLKILRDTIEHERCYLLGHSMGGMISLLYLLQHPLDFNAVALSGPASDVSVDVSLVKRTMSALLSRAFPRLQMNADIEPDWVCGNPAVVECYLNDPLNHGKVSVRWFNDYLQQIAMLKERAHLIQTPLAIWHGEHDQLVEPWVSEALFSRLSHSRKQRSLVVDGLHEILLEDSWQRTAGEMLAWWDKH